MMLENLFFDLVSVPGLRTVICFNRDETPVVHQIGDEGKSSNGYFQRVDERILRGIAPVLRQLRGAAARIELRGANGRFIIRALGSGSSLVCVTNNFLNLPLLELALDAYVAAAEENCDAVIATFRSGEVARMFAALPAAESSLKSFSSIRYLQEKVKAESQIAAPLEQKSNVISFAAPPAPPVSPAPPAPIAVIPAPVAPNAAALKNSGEFAAALCKVSALAVRVLGRSVVANYWKQSQPEIFAKNYEISMDGNIRAIDENVEFSIEQLETGKLWIKKFVARCSVIVTDLPDELKKHLTGNAAALLS